MDGQIKSFVFFLFFLLVSSLLGPADATFPKQNSDENDSKANSPHDNENNEREVTNSSPTEPKPSIFPNQLDISSLQNMPLVILHPKTPINFQMLPGENIADLHQTIAKSLNPSKILELLQSSTFNIPAKSLPPKEHENRIARDRKFANYKPQASVNRPSMVHEKSFSNIPALPRSLLHSPANNGWFQRFRGSFSNMFPSIRPVRENPFQFGLPSMQSPVFLPQRNHMYENINPYMMSSHNQFHVIPPWRHFHTPSMMHAGDLTTDASFPYPTRMLFGKPPVLPFRAPQIMPQHNFGGDLATSGSAILPHRVLPPYPPFRPHVQRHKPTFNNFDGLQAASMDITNAFADFTDSKEHGPEVTQRFGSVGHTITNFLKMMGLGADGGMAFGDVGGFGGGSDMASLESTPIARSMDFFPGYGNQAHMDEIGDFPIFHEDITEDFMKKMNLTNATLLDIKELEKELSKKEIISPVKIKLESMEKDKMSLSKGTKDSKHTSLKMSDAKDASYVPAAPLGKDQLEKNNKNKSKSDILKNQQMHAERPVVSYKVPPTLSTVAPRDRTKPIAIYQHFSPSNKDAPKPPEYAPAQAMPQQEAEDNPNRLVDEDEVRQWRLVNTGQGYVEKRPVPIVDILKDAMHPGSLKVLQKVLAGETVQGTI